MRSKMLILAGLMVALSLSGCITAKVVERERVDQGIPAISCRIAGTSGVSIILFPSCDESLLLLLGFRDKYIRWL